MAKKKSANDIALEALKMDLDFRNRELAAQQAIAAAQQAFERQRMILVEQGAQDLQAQQFAKQYALQIGQLEYEKTLGIAQLGMTAESQRHAQRMDLMKQQFEEEFNTAAQMGFRNGVPTLERYKHDSTLAEQQRQFDVGSTGYNNGRATLEREQFERGLGEQQREFNIGSSGWMNGVATLDREKALEAQRQFDVNTIMNSPRGAADYVAYINNLRGLEGLGLAPGLLGQLATGGVGRVASASNAGEFSGPVASNRDLAMASIDYSRRNGTLSASMDPRLAGLIGTGAQQNVQVSSDPGQAPTGTLTPHEIDRYNVITARDAQLQAAGEGRVSQADLDELAGYQAKLGVAPGSPYTPIGDNPYWTPGVASPYSQGQYGYAYDQYGYGYNPPQGDPNWTGATGPVATTRQGWPNGSDSMPPEFNMVSGGGDVPWSGNEAWAQAQAAANAIDAQNRASFEANRAYDQAGQERQDVFNMLSQDGPPDQWQYESYRYQPTGYENQQVVDGTTQRPATPYAPSDSTFQQYASTPTNYWSSAQAASSTPYSDRADAQSSPGYNAEAVANMFAPVYGQDQTPQVNTGDQWSLQSFRQLNPTEQQYATGLVQDYTNQSPEDFQRAMTNAAPTYARSSLASWGGF